MQVQDTYRFLGLWTVTGGQIVLDNDFGGTYKVGRCTIGVSNPCRIVTMPIPKDDPGSEARFRNLSIRTFGSTRPIINEQRPPDRDPSMGLGRTQKVDKDVKDTMIGNQGSDLYQTIKIEEQVPYNLEILGIYGNVEGNKI